MKATKYYLIMLLSPIPNVANASSGPAPVIALIFLLAIVVSIAVAIYVSINAFNKEQDPKPSLGSIIIKGLEVFVGLSAAGWITLYFFFLFIL